MTSIVQRGKCDDSVPLFFKVEDHLFSVHRSHFEESKMFCHIFQNVAPDGTSEDCPFHLEGINKDDLTQLLRVMDPRQFGDGIPLSLSQCISVLKLSTMWELEKIREVVIQRMSTLPIDVVDKIILARDYVPEWLLPALIDYAQRMVPITVMDVGRLGLDCIIKIARAREKVLQFWQVGSSQQAHFAQSVRSVFRGEIKQMDDWNSEFLAGSSTVRRFDQWKFEADDACYLVDMFFLVENHLFKAYRQYFEVSPVFHGMFRLPVPENSLPDGCSREQPLRLAGITKDDFKQLLRFMDARSPQETAFSVSEWTSILRLSTMWEFAEIRQFAIKEMSKLAIDIVEKIMLARDYHVWPWLIPSLIEYSQRGQPMAEDVKCLGLDYVLKVIEVRMRVSFPLARAHEQQVSSFYHDLTTTLHFMFQVEIGRSRSTWSIQRTSTSPSVLATTLLTPRQTILQQKVSHSSAISVNQPAPQCRHQIHKLIRHGKATLGLFSRLF